MNFAAACVEKSVVPADGTTLPVSGSKLAVPTGDVWDAFKVYFGDNINTSFKTVENGTLTYSVAKGGFQLPDDANGGATGGKYTEIFNGIKDSVTTQIEKLNASVFGDMGSDVMLEKVDSVTGIAAELAAKSTSFKGMLSGNMASMAATFGYDWTNTDPDATNGKTAFLAFYNDLRAQKATEMGLDPTSADALNLAANEILSNYAVLSAAKNTTQSSTDLLKEMQDGIKTSDIKNMLQGTTGSEEALSKSAMMYAMYTAYANGLPESTEAEKAAKEAALNNANDVSLFMTAMDTDPGFQTYLQNGNGQAMKDLEGYLGALTIINSSANTEDKSVITGLLLNGYGTDDLSTALNGLLGK